MKGYLGDAVFINMGDDKSNYGLDQMHIVR